MAISISISITQNSQNITNNTSNVTVAVNAKWTYGSYNKNQKSGWLTIDGTKYTFTSSFNTSVTTSGSQTLFTKTVNVAHATNGTKTLPCSASYTSGVSSGTVTASTSKALTTIPRKSTLAASNGTLATALNLTVTKQADSFTHTITYKCGSASGTVCTKSSSKTVAWNTSNGNTLALSSQNTTGTSVSVTFTITTYNGSASLGSNTKTISMSIPAGVKPSCSVSVSDAAGLADKYGGYIKGYSKFAVKVTPTTAYGSAIKAYNTTANGTKYTSANFTTAAVTTAGTNTITAIVTDKRERSNDDDPAKETVTVLDYSAPYISLLKVKRCNADGAENDKGEYAKVTFSASVTPLNNINSAAYVLAYKKATDTDYTTIAYDQLSGQYEVTEYEEIFAAESGSTYQVTLTVKDDLTSSTKPTTVSTASTPLHWPASGRGLGIGKIAEVEDGLDVGYVIKPNEGFINILLEENTDFNEVVTPNIYVSYDKVASTYKNCPISSGTFKLEVTSGGAEGQVHQTVTYTNKTDFAIYHRQKHSGSWATDSDGNYIWNCIYSVKGKVLWGSNMTSGMYMTAGHTATLTESVSSMPHGIVLVFCYYNGTDDTNYNWQTFFVPKYLATAETSGHTFILARGKFTAIGTKYLYIRDTDISGHDDNNLAGSANGITYENNKFVMRYVIGV